MVTAPKFLFEISLNNTFYVGDKITDIEAAIAAEAIPVLVKTGRGKDEIDRGVIPKNIAVYDDLADFVSHIITQK